jgi:hypothetical protein
VYSGRSRSRFQRTRMSLNAKVAVMRPHISKESSFALVDGQGRLSIQSLHSLKPSSSAAFFAVKDRSHDAPNLHSANSYFFL